MERALLDLLATHTSLAAATSDREGTLTLMTPALERMLGHAYQPLAEGELPRVLGLLYEDGVTPLEVADMPIARARAGEMVIDAVVAVRPVEDSARLRYLRCNGGPLWDDAGAVRGAFVLVQDVTEEWTLRTRQDDLRGRLVTTVNHELRTPVAKLLGHAELLQDRRAELPDWARSSVDAITRAAGDLADLSATMTALVDLEAASHVTPVKTDVVPHLTAAIEELADLARARDVAIDRRLPPALVAAVEVPALRRAVRELLDNALIYAPPGTSVLVGVEADEEWLTITVADQGVGIPAGDRDRLLQPFERGDHPGQRVSSRGLGLAYARTIACAHAGDLALHDARPTGLIAVWRSSRFGAGRPADAPDEDGSERGGGPRQARTDP